MTAVAITTTQFTVAASNSSRKSILIYNQSSTIVHLSTQTGFTLGNEPQILTPGDRVRWPVRYTGAIYGRGDAATGQLLVTEV